MVAKREKRETVREWMWVTYTAGSESGLTVVGLRALPIVKSWKGFVGLREATNKCEPAKFRSGWAHGN